ncbi:MAG: hypothetical protein V2I27_09575 [Erythrobacter sp.]|jgi:hypothetical protein|nr:hypothetical protein [Erythrobacter sp.]
MRIASAQSSRRSGRSFGGRPQRRSGSVSKRLWLAIAALLLAVLGIAWIDGGEEPIRPIAEPVSLPVLR